MGIRCNGGGRKINLKLTISFLLPAILTLVLMIACGGISESDIEATVEARVTEERATEATVEARAQAIAKAMVAATAEAAPTAKPVPPTATPTLVPTTPTPAQVQVITPLPGQPFVVENEATAVALREMPTPTVVPAAPAAAPAATATSSKSEDSLEVTEALPTAKPIQDLDFQMSLPFKTGQEPLGMMPMGETILHPATPDIPNGHPGIDFQWLSRTELIAAANGEVAEIRISYPHGSLLYSVLVISGDFVVAYDVVDIYSVNPDLSVGNKVVSGQVMGYAPYVDSNEGRVSTHWAFGKWTPGSDKPNPEGVVEKIRVNYLCPVPYISEAERARLFRVWDAAKYPNAGEFKGAELRELFPDVCNGPYKNY